MKVSIQRWGDGELCARTFRVALVAESVEDAGMLMSLTNGHASAPVHCTMFGSEAGVEGIIWIPRTMDSDGASWFTKGGKK